MTRIDSCNYCGETVCDGAIMCDECGDSFCENHVDEYNELSRIYKLYNKLTCFERYSPSAEELNQLGNDIFIVCKTYTQGKYPYPLSDKHYFYKHDNVSDIINELSAMEEKQRDIEYDLSQEFRELYPFVCKRCHDALNNQTILDYCKNNCCHCSSCPLHK